MQEEVLEALVSYPPLLDVTHIQEILMVGQAVAYNELIQAIFQL